MSLAIVNSRANSGITAKPVALEIDLAKGIPAFAIVGLPETAVKESKDRVRSAIRNSGFEFPVRRITVNLAPADLPKEGGRFDLPMAIGILAASGQIPTELLPQYEIIGELSLAGDIRPVKGVLPFALAARASGRHIIIPHENAIEASIVHGVEVHVADHLLAVTQHLQGKLALPLVTPSHSTNTTYDVDLSDVRGQYQARRVLEIAAAGGHSLLLSGSPGAGKTMLASRLPTILPPLTDDQALSSLAVASIVGNNIDWQQWRRRPFRAPHHTASAAAMVGGGNPPKPGEISLSHHGVLFLDELPEFSRHVLETLREPMESGLITISRAAHNAEFPAQFQLVAAMNPCPCGYLGDQERLCQCHPEHVRRYQSRLSGPFLDRIDLRLEVAALPNDVLLQQSTSLGETSAIVRQRVITARTRQLRRQTVENARLPARQLLQVCYLDDETKHFLQEALPRMRLSARGLHRLLRVARTVADLAEREQLIKDDLAEALNYRQIGRQSNEQGSATRYRSF